MQRPIISIITPTYKPEDFIIDYFSSIKEQTLSSSLFEVILILNGPKEPYNQYIQEYIENNLKEYNISLLYNEEAGIAAATNIGIDKAQGDYITFIDCDDYISPSYLMDLYEQRADNTIVLADKIMLDDETRITSYDIIHTIMERLYNKPNLSYWEVRHLVNSAARKLIPRNIIGDARFLPIYGLDSVFMFTILTKNVKFRIASLQAIYYCRYRKQSESRAKRNLSYLIKNQTAIIKEVSKIYFSNPGRYRLALYLRAIAASAKAILHNLFS